ncbi:MAG: hypothetical protein V3S40_00900 [Kiloniellales bacterium]
MGLASLIALTVVLLVGLSLPAFAYIGPGAGLGALGAALGLLAAVFMALGLLLFWPIRRLLRRGKRDAAVETEGSGHKEPPGNPPNA